MTLFFQVLYILCLYEAQISGERLQDHWSSGIKFGLGCLIVTTFWERAARTVGHMFFGYLKFKLFPIFVLSADFSATFIVIAYLF